MLPGGLATAAPIFMLLLATVGMLWDFKHQNIGQNLPANMEGFCRVSHNFMVFAIQ